MDTLISQVQHFNQLVAGGLVQLWQDQITRWERATEAAWAAQRAQVARFGDAVELGVEVGGKLGRAVLDEWQDSYARWRGAQETAAASAKQA